MQNEIRTLNYDKSFALDFRKSKIRISNHQIPYVTYYVPSSVVLFFLSHCREHPPLTWCCMRYWHTAFVFVHKWWKTNSFMMNTFTPFILIPVFLRICPYSGFHYNRIHVLPPLNRFKGKFSYLNPLLPIGEISFYASKINLPFGYSHWHKCSVEIATDSSLLLQSITVLPVALDRRRGMHVFSSGVYSYIYMFAPYLIRNA